MAGMSFTYDTQEIRSRAKQVRTCMQQVDRLRKNSVREVRNAVDNCFQGEAADALEERLDRSQRELNQIYSELSTLYTAIIKFVEKLEEIDRQLAREMND